LSAPAPSRANRHPRRGPRAGQVVEALVALSALLALTVGIPVALWRLGGWPLPHTIQPAELWQVLRRPIPDAFWGKALISLTWLYWLHFIACLAAEAVATIRGRVAARIPGGRFSQALAARLIGAILLLAPTSSPLPAAMAGVPLVRTTYAAAAHVPTERSPTSQPSATPAPHAEGELKRYVVRHWQPGQRRDTLWSIAQRYLRDAQGRPAPQRWPEIFALNQDRPLPDPPGGTFTNARWIFPGQELLLPADAVDLPAAGRSQPPAQPPPIHHAPTSPSTPPTTAQPTPRAPTRPARPPSESPEPIPASHLFQIVTALAGAGLLAAGVIAALSRLRRVQQHRRRRGRRIKLPTGRAADVEVALRVTQEQDTAQRLDLALRALAGAIRRADLPVPPVHGVVVTQAGLEVLLGRVAPAAPPPFEPAGSGDRWRLSEQVDNEQLTAIANHPPPLPGLVTVGHTGQGRLLVNLEHARLLTVTGPPGDTRALLTAMATELATSTWSAALDLILVGFGDELAPLDNVRRAQDLHEILPTVQRRLERASDLPEARDHGSSLAARLASTTPDSLTPTIILCASQPDPRSLEQLREFAGRQGPTPLGVVIPAAEPQSTWHLDLIGHGRARLAPLGLEVRAQMLSAEAYQAIGKLLATAADTDDVAPGTPPYDTLKPEASLKAGRPRLTLINGHANATPQETDEEESSEELVPVSPKEVCVLGKVHVSGVPVIERRKSLELLAYLALHPRGADAEQIWEALWPERPLNRGTLHTTVYTARNRLGDASDGTPYLPDAREGFYRLHPELGLDWTRFQKLTELAQQPGTNTAAVLRQALELVTGSPLQSSAPRSFEWAIVHRTEIEAAVGEAAEQLATLHLEADDHTAATWAARRGLLASPYDERLYRQLMLAADAAGNSGGVDATMRELVHVMGEDLEPLDDLHPETIKLYQQLRGKRPIPS
jgi:DNA-binding SARP family transcriptional activator